MVSPRAYVNFGVLDFDSKTITWSLKITLEGLHKYPVLAVQVGSSIVYRYDARYDHSLNITTIEESLSSNFTAVIGRFPHETRFLVLYFAINATVNILETGGVLKLPTSNYAGLFSVISIRSFADWAVANARPELGEYGEVYRVGTQIERSKGVAQYLEFAMGSIPGMLNFILWILWLVMAIQIVIFLLWRIRGSPYRRLLNTNYFAIVVGIVFFLPMYMLSLRPLMAPLPITEGDEALSQLLANFVLLMTVSFLASLISPTETAS